MWFGGAYANLPLEGWLSHYDWSRDGHVTQIRPMIVIPVSEMSHSLLLASLSLRPSVSLGFLGAIDGPHIE